MNACVSRSRHGFTLLEMLLASGITLLLMGALYVSMEVQLKYAAAGREIVDQSTLARALLNRIAADISVALTPITATKAVASGGATPTAATGTAGAAAPTTGPETSTTSLTSITPLNMGVVGDNGVLTLYISRLPPRGPSASSDSGNADQQQLGASDIRRVSYWLTTAGNGGLVCQDFARVTADDEESVMPPGLPNEQQMIIADEVIGLTFRYFDGTSWLDTWDGAMLGSDEATPVGPPRAIEIRLDIRRPDATGPDDRIGMKSYRHVASIRAANAQPVMTADTTTPAPTTGGAP